MDLETEFASAESSLEGRRPKRLKVLFLVATVEI